MKIWNMPWILFLLALVLILTKRFLLKEVHERITLAEGSYLVAVFYYAAYLIDTQSFEFRYFFPSWLILFVIICSLIGDLLFRTKYVERLTISAISVFIIVGFLGGYNEYTRSGNEALANIENVGNLLYQDDENEVLYLNGKLYFIATPNSDTEYRYFLHFYPAEGDMINSDFWFKDKALITAFWNKKIAEVSMPNQDINSIEFGQYYNSERFWGANADVSSMY